MSPTDKKAEAAMKIEGFAAQISTGFENSSDPSPDCHNIRPPPPLLPIIETLLHKFYLEGESIKQVHEYMRDQGVYYDEVMIHRVLGTYNDPVNVRDPIDRNPYIFPFTSAGLVDDEVKAKELIDKRMRMFVLIFNLAQKRKSQ